MNETIDSTNSLSDLHLAIGVDRSAEISNLRKAAKFRTVFGRGSAVNPRLIIIGDAPAEDELSSGAAYSNGAGAFLDNLLHRNGISPDDAWITNILKYPTPGNRPPTINEILRFMPYLVQEISIVSGADCSTVVGLGELACSALAGDLISVADKAGSWVSMPGGFRLFVSCRPSWGLQNPGNQQKMLRDFAVLRKTRLR